MASSSSSSSYSSLVYFLHTSCSQSVPRYSRYSLRYQSRSSRTLVRIPRHIRRFLSGSSRPSVPFSQAKAKGRSQLFNDLLHHTFSYYTERHTDIQYSRIVKSTHSGNGSQRENFSHFQRRINLHLNIMQKEVEKKTISSPKNISSLSLLFPILKLSYSISSPLLVLKALPPPPPTPSLDQNLFIETIYDHSQMTLQMKTLLLLRLSVSISSN